MNSWNESTDASNAIFSLLTTKGERYYETAIAKYRVVKDIETAGTMSTRTS